MSQQKGIIIPTWAIGLLAGLISSGVSLGVTWGVRNSDIINIKEAMAETKSDHVKVANHQLEIEAIKKYINTLSDGQEQFRREYREDQKVLSQKLDLIMRKP